MTHDSLKTAPIHLLYFNPHHYPQPGSSEVVVNYDLQSVIIIKLCLADVSCNCSASDRWGRLFSLPSHPSSIPISENSHSAVSYLVIVDFENNSNNSN